MSKHILNETNQNYVLVKRESRYGSLLWIKSIISGYLKVCFKTKKVFIVRNLILSRSNKEILISKYYVKK